MSNTPDPPARPGGSLSNLDRLLAMPPLAIPVSPDAELPEYIPLALPVTDPAPPTAFDLPAAEPPPPATLTCAACAAVNPADAPYCGDCGYYFSDADRAAAPPAAVALAAPPGRLKDRYELTRRVSERSGVERYQGLDHAASPPAPVIVARQPLPQPPPPEPPTLIDADDEILPSFDDPGVTPGPTTDVIPGSPVWPGVGWERKLLAALELPALPAELDYFCDDTHEYLVLEVPRGRSLWDAWDDPDGGARERYGYLVQVAEALHRLHQCNAILDGLRPDLFVVTDRGDVRLADLSDLLPIPLPPDAPVKGGLYTAPELVNGSGLADARADLYGFGAMVYALMLGRELSEKTDFDEAGTPKLFSRFPDLHPGFARLMLKTLRKEVEARFPTDEARRDDQTGFSDLIRQLEVLRRTQDNVRLDIASWTSTGAVRTGNEDAFAVLHAAESRQDDLGEAALVLLCDGMGGYEAGEVAAALAIQSLREALVKLKPFAVAAGASAFVTDALSQEARPGGHLGPKAPLDEVKSAIKAALKEANRKVFQAARAPGTTRRGMGCTAEVVYLDGRHVVVGHVGDSRTYHLHHGRLVQLTRDQTLVNRLVELGTLSAEEAETHPRRNELQQALGGQPDVDPALYHGELAAGDWVLVCSDGLTNHISAREIEQMLLTEATSAEMAARRLVNLTLILGASDNVTVVAVRMT
jgi:serine/threonine protein phosphatase PrpC